jgi:hypothetical protein
LQQRQRWSEESDNEVVLPEFVSHQHTEHNQQQQHLLQQHHQQGFHSTESDYPHQPQQMFLEQLITGREEPSSVQAQLPGGLAGDLSAFHALMAQTVPRNEFPQLQLLNPRDQQPHGAEASHWLTQQQQHGADGSHWPAQQQHSTSAAEYSSSQQLYPPFSSLV